jgi:SAM-dependent methyltransferase
MRTTLGRMMPDALRQAWRRRRIEELRRRNHGRKVKEIFSEIYQLNRWGGEQGDFNSGSGSSAEHAGAYARAVRQFIADHGVRHVVDLGCGDFRVGAQLLEGSEVRYSGIDVVPALIESNRVRYGSERVQFACLDIIQDPLPPGELCLIRQVLQHLSNEQIRGVLSNVRGYPWVLVTEHYPAEGALRARNLDKPCGEDVRIYDGSAVFLDAPPFNCRIAAPLLDVDAGHWLMHPGERIRTFLIDNTQAASGMRS